MQIAARHLLVHSPSPAQPGAERTVHSPGPTRTIGTERIELPHRTAHLKQMLPQYTVTRLCEADG